MKKIVSAAILSLALIGSASFASALESNQTSTPWTVNPEAAQVIALLPRIKTVPSDANSDVLNICNDAKMACITGVDTCCSTKKACPSNGVCP
jgi:hypothetical protein